MAQKILNNESLIDIALDIAAAGALALLTPQLSTPGAGNVNVVLVIDASNLVSWVMVMPDASVTFFDPAAGWTPVT